MPKDPGAAMDKEKLLSLGRPARQCTNCGQPISGLPRHPSSIKTAERNAFERFDFCPVCWEHVKDEAFESFWITRRDQGTRKLPKLTRRERAVAIRALFESLWERRQDEEVETHLYFLAHLLMKWGGLKWRENRSDTSGGEVVVFEDPIAGDRIEVTPGRQDDQSMVAIKKEVEEFLKQYSAEDQEIML